MAMMSGLEPALGHAAARGKKDDLLMTAEQIRLRDKWNGRLYLELVTETVTVDVVAGPGNIAPSADAEAPAPARRPRPAAPREPATDVPF
jgi:hypothetical protein